MIQPSPELRLLTAVLCYEGTRCLSSWWLGSQLLDFKHVDTKVLTSMVQPPALPVRSVESLTEVSESQRP